MGLNIADNVASFWNSGMLINSLVDGALDVKFFNLTLSNVLWETQFFFELLQNDSVGISLILFPVPWSILFLLELLNLVEGSLNIHNVIRNSIEVGVIWVVIGGVNVIIIFAVPGNVDEWIFQFPNMFVGILITFCLAFGVARFFILFDFHEVRCFVQFIIDNRHEIVTASQTDLDQSLLDR